MFEATLSAKLQKIFAMKKVTYAAPAFDGPGEVKAAEHGVLFIDVETPHFKITDGRARARVTGKVTVYANSEKLPFGYFAKQIALHLDDTKDLFFSEIEANSRVYQNIVERSFSFTYFFNSQYDPAIGNITDITIEVSI